MVIGSGIGGLTAGALLSHEGQRVLIVERHDRPGGYAHSFVRGRYRFDSAVHLVGGCRNGVIDGLLRQLRVRDRCEFIPADPFYSARFPGTAIQVPATFEGFVEAHARAFPGERAGIQWLVALAEQAAGEVRRFPFEPTIRQLLVTPRRTPTLFRYRNATLQDVLTERIGDPRARAALAALWPYLGVPPSRLSFLYWASMLTSYLEDGAAYCRGSWQNLANALADALRRDGGDLLLGSAVRSIRVEGRRVTGVRLDNGQSISARAVISNTDPIQTFDEMVTSRALPAGYTRKLHRYRPSLSAFVLFLATDLDPRAIGASHQMLCASDWDPDRAYGSMLQGRVGGIGIDVPTMLDPSLAPSGQHLVIVTALVPYSIGASWREEKSRFAEAMLSELDRQLPGLRNHLSLLEGATPRTMERYTLNMSGSVYGWDVQPDQVGPGRLPARTPIDGLVLAGHWTRPGGGVYAVAVSGIHAAEILLGRSTNVLGWGGELNRPGPESQAFDR